MAGVRLIGGKGEGMKRGEIKKDEGMRGEVCVFMKGGGCVCS